MASKTTWPIEGFRAETWLITSKMQGAAAANLVNSDAAPATPGGGEIVSGTRTGAGIFDLVFRKKFPMGLSPIPPGIVGTTTGLVGTLTAWNPQAGTATVKFAVGNTATDPAATDFIYFAFLVRNSGKN